MKKNTQNDILFLDTLVKRELRVQGERKIVIVDDCPNALLLMGRYLEDFSKLRVEVYQNVFEAMKSVLSDEPDMMIIDVEMPKVNGIELNRFLNRMSLFNIPTLFVSRNRNYKITAETGSNCIFLPKPLAKESFLEKVGNIIPAVAA
ncbi:MAG: response regulator [Bacteriovoracaceae bacterium]|nr:response regulator [Bacteriovoracaceae bacterium]